MKILLSYLCLYVVYVNLPSKRKFPTEKRNTKHTEAALVFTDDVSTLAVRRYG